MQKFKLQVELFRDNEMLLTLFQEMPRRGRARRASPRLLRIERIWGKPLAVAYETIRDILHDDGHRVSSLRPGARRTGNSMLSVGEDAGVRLGLLMKAIKPLRKLERIRRIVEEIGEMPREEALYWFSKAINSPSDSERRRAMKAMRILLARE